MFDWLSPWVFVQTMARVVLVWLAFYGAGKLLRKPLRVDGAFPLLPSELVGLLAFVVLTVPLSLLGIMNRTVCPVILFLMAIPGTLFVYGFFRDRFFGTKTGYLSIIPLLFMFFILLQNFTYASMPDLAFDDPLITYAVQPDRWLNRGRVFWLEETTFSGFPLLYEMTAVWPASISSDRMNQLSVLQVFQMSMLVLAVFRGLSVLRVRRNLWIPVATIIFLSTHLYIWCARAKTDTMAILFCTMALTSAIRERARDFSVKPFSSWLYMGLAFASKQTAALVLVPFFLYSAGSFFRFSLKWKAWALAAFLVVPFAYGVRTMLKTGSPSYPVYPVSFMLRDSWEENYPEEHLIVSNRASYLFEQSSYPVLKHVGIFFGSMEGCILLLLTGIIAALFKKTWKKAGASLPVLLYCFLAIAFFWPPWWGVKYAILIFPFAGILGAKLLQGFRGASIVSYCLLAISFVIPGFVAVASDSRPFNYRLDVIESVFLGRWTSTSGYRMYLSTPEGMAHMWANSALPRESVIFSIQEEKRYFFDGVVIVGWRHPIGQRLYFDNSLEDELAVLDDLDVDYVGFYRGEPSILGLERNIAILDHIGIGEILEPVIILDGGYQLCRYNRN